MKIVFMTILLFNNYIFTKQDCVIKHEDIFSLHIFCVNVTSIEKGSFVHSPHINVKITNSTIPVFTKKIFSNISPDIVTVTASGVKTFDTNLKYQLVEWKYLDLSRNQLVEIPNGTFDGAHQLKTLNLSYNYIEMVGTLNSAIDTVDLSYNKIKEIPALTNSRSNLKILNLGNNFITKVMNDSFEGFDLDELHLCNNEIELIEIRAFIKQSSLKRLYLGGNKLYKMGGDPFNFLKPLDNLIEFNLYMNSLTIKQNILQKPNLIQHLDLGGNIIEKAILQDFNNLVVLEIERTNSSTISVDHFIHNTKLEMLDLAFNNIEYLLPGTFSKLQYLSTLYLTGNKLESLPNGLFLYNLHLAHLDVSNNHLKNFNVFSLNRRNSRRVIYLDDNLLSCDHLSDVVSTLHNMNFSTIIAEGHHTTVPNIDGNLCLVKPNFIKHNVTLQKLLERNAEILEILEVDLKDLQEGGEAMLAIIEDKLDDLYITPGIIHKTSIVHHDQENILVNSSLLITLICVQIIFLLFIMAIVLYFF